MITPNPLAFRSLIQSQRAKVFDLLDLKPHGGSLAYPSCKLAMIIQSFGRLETPRFAEPKRMIRSSHNGNESADSSEQQMLSVSSEDILRSVYFDSLEELEKWYCEAPTPSQAAVEAFNQTRFAMSGFSRGDANGKSSLLICHDFRGGYQANEDRSPQGYFPHQQNGNRYFLQFPQLCDVFVYFSHHCVTVPPLCWVEMCHRSGIPCYGTVMFEGKDKKSFSRLDRLMARDSRGEFVFVKILVELVRRFKLDGLLINVETRFSDPSLSKSLGPWLCRLRGDLRACNGARVIWYDAYVGSKNQVHYVNGVSELNYEYFDQSDGFLTNYWWSKNELEATLSNVGKLGLKKVFVGYDVWGRGLLPGVGRKGGFETGKDISRFRDSAVGLFAPAWTYEFLGYENFKENDTIFWRAVSESVRLNNTSVRILSDGGFIFHTNFNQGAGSSFCVCGEKVFDGFWANGGLQSQTPDTLLEDDTNAVLKIALDDSDAFTGGSCLWVSHNVFAKDTFSSESLPTKLLNWTADSPRILFSLNQECYSPNIKVRCTFQSNSFRSKAFFQLQLTYQILKRDKVLSSGKLVFPLMSHRALDWVTLEKSFIAPHHSDRETLKLTVLEIAHVDTDLLSLPFVEDTVEDSDDWVVIPTKQSTGLDEADFGVNSFDEGPISEDQTKIGEISVVAALREGSFRSSRVSSLNRVTLRDGYLLSWAQVSNGDEFCDFWCVYVDDAFLGVTTVSQFVVKSDCRSQTTSSGDNHPHSTIKVRIDCVSVTGELSVGVDYKL